MTNVTVPEFAAMLATRLNYPLKDMTDWTGRTISCLSWSADETRRVGISDRTNTGEPGTSVFAAVQQQLGLKLEPGKGPNRVAGNRHSAKNRRLPTDYLRLPLLPARRRRLLYSGFPCSIPLKSKLP